MPGFVIRDIAPDSDSFPFARVILPETVASRGPQTAVAIFHETPTITVNADG